MRNRWWLLAAVMLATVSQANIYTLNQDSCTGTCGSGPFGTVTVTQTVVDRLDFSVVLNAGNSFHATNAGPHPAFVFNLAGNPSLMIAGLPVGFVGNGVLAPGTNSAAGLGSFDYVIRYPHSAGAPITSISFSALSAGLTLASLEGNSKGVWFAADITGSNGNTGNVAAVPEPSEWSMLIAGLLVVGYIGKRRRHNMP